MKNILLACVVVMLFVAHTQQAAQGSSVSQGQMTPNYNDRNHPEMSDADLQRIAQATIIGFYIGVIITFAIAAFLLFKCYKKRQSTQQIKEQMQAKRYQYASTLGINLYELNNDPRLTYTIHV